MNIIPEQGLISNKYIITLTWIGNARLVKMDKILDRILFLHH